MSDTLAVIFYCIRKYPYSRVTWILRNDVYKPFTAMGLVTCSLNAFTFWTSYPNPLWYHRARISIPNRFPIFSKWRNTNSSAHDADETRMLYYSLKRNIHHTNTSDPVDTLSIHVPRFHSLSLKAFKVPAKEDSHKAWKDMQLSTVAALAYPAQSFNFRALLHFCMHFSDTIWVFLGIVQAVSWSQIWNLDHENIVYHVFTM